MRLQAGEEAVPPVAAADSGREAVPSDEGAPESVPTAVTGSADSVIAEGTPAATPESVPLPPEQPMETAPEPVTVVVENPAEATISAPLPEQPQEVEPTIQPPDSSWQLYMIAPGDFLIKIAKHEYGDWQMWRKIYHWNREEIGDNPNLIFPYHTLDLLKPREEVKNCVPEFEPYTVRTGDNLWNIAGKLFHDERAWIVLFWDNEELLDRTEGVLKPGMVLQVRQNCIPLPE
ncbi:MAG: LysM peptidoglycan-binding domain-containing protein [Candidatus Neomarinimicrobiota bacterium]|nr:MAG: LysM peptidoglycan-binding domain-containing protein [Candidatus Neomarinimicrobiota bacterium]